MQKSTVLHIKCGGLTSKKSEGYLIYKANQNAGTL